MANKDLPLNIPGLDYEWKRTGYKLARDLIIWVLPPAIAYSESCGVGYGVAISAVLRVLYDVAKNYYGVDYL